MLDNKKDHIQKQTEEQTAENSTANQEQMSKLVSVQDRHDLVQDVARLNKRIVNEQQQIQDRFSVEQKDLKQPLGIIENLVQVLKQEREKQTNIQPGVRESLDKDQKIDSSALEQFKYVHNEQLSQRQQLEESFFKMQAEAITNLEKKQSQQNTNFTNRVDILNELIRTNKTEGPTAIQRLEDQRQQLNQSQIQEREQLIYQFNKQFDVLQKQHDELNSQMRLDRLAFREALSEKNSGPEREALIKEVLARQESASQQLKHNIEKLAEDLQRPIGVQVENAVEIRKSSENLILDQKFSKHQAIKILWNEAVKATQIEHTSARDAYDAALKRFISRLTNEKDQRAIEARKIFEDAGFKFIKDEESGEIKEKPAYSQPRGREN